MYRTTLRDCPRDMRRDIEHQWRKNRCVYGISGVWKGSSKNHGQFNVTMDNGDITYYTYEASGPTDVKSPASNKWNISGGTGKHKDMKGSGVCSGTRHDDGSSDWLCTGTS